jgi:hypothetical protein
VSLCGGGGGGCQNNNSSSSNNNNNNVKLVDECDNDNNSNSNIRIMMGNAGASGTKAGGGDGWKHVVIIRALLCQDFCCSGVVGSGTTGVLAVITTTTLNKGE